jgi:hypothetical protein
MVALERARGFGLVKYAGACSNELLVKLALMVAAVPALPVEGLERPAALRDAVERAGVAHDAASLIEELHGAEGPLGLGWPVRGLVHGVEVVEREHLLRVLNFEFL